MDKMTMYIVLGIVAIIVVVGLAYFLLRPQTQQTVQDTVQEIASASPVSEIFDANRVILQEQNESGQNGTTTLEEVDGKLKVTIDVSALEGESAQGQPAHIHSGSCPEPGPVTYPLQNVVDGKSETTLDVSLQELMGQLPLAINIHKSAAELTTYTSCGNIEAS